MLSQLVRHRPEHTDAPPFTTSTEKLKNYLQTSRNSVHEAALAGAPLLPWCTTAFPPSIKPTRKSKNYLRYRSASNAPCSPCYDTPRHRIQFQPAISQATSRDSHPARTSRLCRTSPSQKPPSQQPHLPTWDPPPSTPIALTTDAASVARISNVPAPRPCIPTHP